MVDFLSWFLVFDNFYIRHIFITHLKNKNKSFIKKLGKVGQVGQKAQAKIK